MKKKAAPKKAARNASKAPSRRQIIPSSAPGVPGDVIALIERAAASGRWLIAIFRVEGGVVHLNFVARDFPENGIEPAIRMTEADLRKLKGE